MKNQKTKDEFGLLPNYFKRVGIVIMLFSIVPAAIAIAMHIKLSATGKEFLKLITMNTFILGLLFIAWAKDKIEDEMTVAIRLKSMSFTFIWTVLLVIIGPFINILFKEPTSGLTAQSLVLSMLLVYLLIYYMQKKGR